MKDLIPTIIIVISFLFVAWANIMLAWFLAANGTAITCYMQRAVGYYDYTCNR